MEVPMFEAIGISEWVAASITVWLAAQLPLGMLVGFYLRRATALSAVDASEPMPVVIAQRKPGWQVLLQGRVLPAHRAL